MRLPAGLFDALLARLQSYRFAPADDDRDLWLLILASDPDGIWYPLPNADRRQPDDAGN